MPVFPDGACGGGQFSEAADPWDIILLLGNQNPRQGIAPSPVFLQQSDYFCLLQQSACQCVSLTGFLFPHGPASKTENETVLLPSPAFPAQVFRQ